MRNALFATLLTLLSASALNAQQTTVYPDSMYRTNTDGSSRMTPVLQVSPYAGWMFFGDYFKTRNDVSFSHENRPIYGAELALSFSRNVALVGNFGYSKTHWTFKNYFGPNDDLNLSSVGVWVYDGALRLQFPSVSSSGSSFIPFIQAGAGAIRYTADANDIRHGNTNFAFNAALGADFQVNRSIGIRLMAKDYITSLSWKDASSVSLEGNVGSRTANSIGVTLGLNIGF
jgi:hypothetical protein